MAEKKQRILGVNRAAADVVAGSGEDENSKYKVGEDIYVLLDEVLNNSIRSVLIFDEFSGEFTDMELYSFSICFRRNYSVIAITMSGVDIGDEGVSLLCDVLLHSKIQYIDFTNTPLDEEAGRSLAALARSNDNLRTVIVDDTLISEELMDEIDTACQFNDANAEGVAPAIEPINPDRVRYCVAHVFQACPHGDSCIFSHEQIGEGGKGSSSSTADGVLQHWEKKMASVGSGVESGATWRGGGNGGDSDDDGGRRIKIDSSKIRELKEKKEAKKRKKEQAERAAKKKKGQQHRKGSQGFFGSSFFSSSSSSVAVVAAAGVACTAVAAYSIWRRWRSP